ncbi:MAG: glycosyltransferase family 4 protein [Candidatus Omnitrophota bacterium]|nr:glycosyltransferase family 4 protein [Candidatus Omnitrophota bacterium]
MRIGFLADELAPGSAPVIIGHTIRGLRELGHEAECLLIVRKPYLKLYPEIFDYYLRGDVPIRYILDELPSFFRKYNFKFPGFSFFSGHHISSGLFAPLVFKKNEYDIIIANCQYTSFIARPLSVFKKIPYLQLIWDPAPYTFKKIYLKRKMRFFSPILYPLTLLLDKIAYGGCKAIITSGRLHHNYLKRITKKNLEILYPGCVPVEKIPAFSSRKNIILTYDRWDIGNLPNLYLDVLERLNNRNIKLVIGGFWHPMSLRSFFVKDVEKRNLSAQVELIGPLGEAEIRELCSRAMVHVHHNEEAFGMQSLEAAACGCPIIIPAGSGVTDLFRHGVHGFFPPKGDIKALTEYVRIIFENPRKSEEMGKAAWEIAKLNTWGHYVKTLDEIIRRCVN